MFEAELLPESTTRHPLQMMGSSSIIRILTGSIIFSFSVLLTGNTQRREAEIRKIARFFSQNIEILTTSLSLGKDDNSRHQNAGAQGKKAVFLMFCFCLRQEMGGPDIDQGAC